MLKKITTPPRFEDQEQNDTTAQLWTVVLAMAIMSALYIALWVVLAPNQSFRIIYAFPLFPLYAWLFYLLKKGKVSLAANALIIGVWLILFNAASFSGGVLAPGYSGLLLTVLMAGIFLNKSAARRLAWLSVLSGGALVFLERQGIMPAASRFTDSTTMWIAQAVYFFVAASLLQMATRRISNALERAEREIGQRAHAERQLRQAEEKYRALVERVPAVIYSVASDANARWLYLGPGIKELTGYSAEEWVSGNQSWDSHIHPEDRDEFYAGVERTIREGRHFLMEYRFQRRDGATIWIQDGSLSVTDSEARNTKVFNGFMVDVTDKKQAEEKLKSNELLLSAIIENIPFDLWVCDENDRYILQNPVSRQLAGDLIGKTVGDLDLLPNVRAEIKAQHRMVLGGESVRREEAYEVNGKEFHALFIGAPIRDSGAIRGHLGMNIDITEQKRIQKALEDAELQYRTLVEQTSVTLYRDRAVAGGPSIFISPQIENMIGYAPAEFSSNPEFWQSLLHPTDRERVMSEIDEIIETEKNIVSEYRLKAKDGRWVWLRDEAALVKDKEGKPLYVQGVYIDITNQKLLEAQREALIAELEAKNEELERFTYTVSHDLKAPLITMGGFLGFLEQDALKGDTVRLKEDLLRISEANLKMQRLLNELLELSRIGRMMNFPEDVPFEQIVTDALARVASRLEEKRIQVKTAERPPVVRGDRLRLVEVLQNLLDNAAKFMGAQPHPRIEIGFENRSDETVFFVRDNGIGIDPKFHAKVFDLFGKLDPQAEGTGIGLALVKRIVEVHGGKIWIESELGNGAAFYFTLPLGDKKIPE
ncbi:MAG: PAS domain S-box protein [Anaerolineales bacterium]|nr:PAS domain S-box protein [Anaerolineales bacterium]